MSTERWSRPESVPFPSVWRRCNGKRPLADGSLPRFRIQDVTEELYDAVLDNLCTHLLRDEPMCSSNGLGSDPVSLREARQLWREKLGQRVALVALLEGEGEDDPPRVVGCNLTGVAFVEDKGKHLEFQGSAMIKMIKALEYVESIVDVFERYGVNRYLSALGLSVSPEFRGQGLGIELLRARFDLGRAVGLPLTVTVFTAMSSQILAHRVGMEVLVEVEYDQYREDGQLVFPGVTVKSFKLMAKRIEPENMDSH